MNEWLNHMKHNLLDINDKINNWKRIQIDFPDRSPGAKYILWRYRIQAFRQRLEILKQYIFGGI